ncbi:MAG: ribosomal-processing cysteine protease Prp [Defluviitaleaceae bacterium]|nr:ribosomal-processing cysteine protease Prp [Defluviitaleaceae bacterium]
MVKIYLYENGFKAYNHTDPVVCAAVSALSINTVNSIEALTDAKFICEHDDEGFLKFSLDSEDEKAKLLLKSFKLGIYSIKESYPKHIQIMEE